jgi:outer membrane protein TolC
VRWAKRSRWLWVCWLTGSLGSCALATRAEPPKPGDASQPAVLGSRVPPEQAQSRTILSSDVHLIDLNTALKLGGVRNPDLLVSRQVVVEAVAERQLAAAQFLPSINAGTSYNTHSGVLQQSNGNILSVNRSSIYVGAGSLAVAGGTVQIPGVVLSGNTDEVLFRYLEARQYVRQREFATLAVRNQVLLRVCQAYCDLLLAEGRPRSPSTSAATPSRWRGSPPSMPGPARAVPRTPTARPRSGRVAAPISAERKEKS